MRVSIAVFFLWLAVGAGIIFEQEPWGKDALTFGAGLSLLSWGIINYLYSAPLLQLSASVRGKARASE